MRPVRYRFKRHPRHWGFAYPESWMIDLDPEMDDQTLMDIAIHETAHLVCPDLSEEAVDRLGRHAAELLWRMGFRRDIE